MAKCVLCIEVSLFQSVLIEGLYDYHGCKDYSFNIVGCAKEEINPNVLMVKFSVIGECHDVHTGDPVVCQKKGCTAILNHLSKMTEQPEGKSSVSTGVCVVIKPGPC